MFDNFKGPARIKFSSGDRWHDINVKQMWFDASTGNILYIEDVNGFIYNWGNIEIFTKVESSQQTLL